MRPTTILVSLIIFLAILASGCVPSPEPATPTPSQPPPASTPESIPTPAPEPTPGPTPEQSPPPPPKELTPLQEEDFTYTGFEDQPTSAHLAMLDATWENNKLIVTWELTNTANRKILLNLLEIVAYDQMGNKGEHGFRDGDTPLSISPSLTHTQKPWPGETVQFDSKWKFGPLSESITIKFICRHFNHGESSREESPPFTIRRPPS